jgi:hypothetical protein
MCLLLPKFFISGGFLHYHSRRHIVHLVSLQLSNLCHSLCFACGLHCRLCQNIVPVLGGSVRNAVRKCRVAAGHAILLLDGLFLQSTSQTRAQCNHELAVVNLRCKSRRRERKSSWRKSSQSFRSRPC